MTYCSAVSLMQQSHIQLHVCTKQQGIKICLVGLPWNKANAYCQMSIDHYYKHQQPGNDDEVVL